MMRAHQIFCAAAFSLACASVAAAEPRYTLRLATVAPDGTAWARELRAFARDVAGGTDGAVAVKWVYGGIAGDERQVQGRIERGQLDGTASGGMMCQTVAPSFKVTRVLGVFQNRDEAGFVLARLRPTFEKEAQQAGFQLLALTGIGPEVAFTRQPPRSLEELRKMKLWRWDLDEVAIRSDAELGLGHEILPLGEAGRAFDEGRVDGFYAVPAAVLAFQWFTRSLYLTDMATSFLWGCLLVADRALERLPPEHQKVVRAAAVKLGMRIEDVGRQQDAQLLGGLFQKQGVKLNPVPARLRNDFLQAARQARERLGEQLVPQRLLREVLAILADYRVEHPQ